MKRLVLACLLLGLATGTRGDDPQPKDKMGGDAPGPEHRALTKLVGEYTTATTMNMGGPPQTSKGTAKITSVLEGRFIAEDGKGDMMGMQYMSHKMYGYNTVAKKYEGVWMWTNGTSMMNLSGTSSDGGKSVVFNASFDQGGSKMTFGITMKRIDDDHFTVEMTGKNPDGTPGGTMMTTYTRKK